MDAYRSRISDWRGEQVMKSSSGGGEQSAADGRRCRGRRRPSVFARRLVLGEMKPDFTSGVAGWWRASRY